MQVFSSPDREQSPRVSSPDRRQSLMDAELILARVELYGFLAANDVPGFLKHVNSLLSQRNGRNFQVLQGCVNDCVLQLVSMSMSFHHPCARDRHVQRI